MKSSRLFLIMAIGLVLSGFCSPNDEPYMKNYVKYMMNDEALSSLDEYPRYALVYIDNDDIPEMVLQGESEAEGLYVLTQRKGAVSALHLDGLLFSFVEKSGLFSDGQHCNFGDCSEEIFMIQDGKFVLKATWHSVDLSMAADFFEADDADDDETEMEEEIEYYFNDNEVDEATAERLLNEAFYSKGKTIDIEEFEWFDKEELLKGNH